MKRMLFEGDCATKAATILFGDRDDYDPAHYQDYDALEVVSQEDGRFSVWGNREEDTDLLRDTKPDRFGILRQLEPLAEIVEEEMDEPDESDAPDRSDVTNWLLEPDEEDESCN